LIIFLITVGFSRQGKPLLPTGALAQRVV